MNTRRVGNRRRSNGRPSTGRRPNIPSSPLLVLLVVLAAGCGAAATTLLPSTKPAESPLPSAIAGASATGASTFGSSTASPGPTATRRPSTPSTATASTTPTAPAPPGTPAVTLPPAAGPSVLVVHGPTSVKRIALTFDMGGRIAPALDIYNFLTSNDVHATIFFTGAIVDSPNTGVGRTILQNVCARPAQFAFGNHSYSHPSFTDITSARMKAELSETEQSMAKYCGRPPRPFFRPPNGAYNSTVLQTVGAAGYSRTIYWTIDTLDWAPPGDATHTPDPRYQTTAQIIANVKSHVGPGSIILMHMGGYNTYPAIQQLVPWLRGQGYEFVNLHEMLDV